MNERDAAAARLIEVARHLSARGLSPGSSGNLSVRVGDRILLTPTGSSLARVQADDLAEVDLAGAPLSDALPTKEAAIHIEAYAADAAAGAVVHLHSPAATAIACLPARASDGLADLPAFTPYRVMSLGEVPRIPYAAPGDAELGRGVGEQVARGRRAMLLAQHGSVVVAASIERAADVAEELEASAALALALAGRDAVELTPEQQKRLIPRE